MWETAPSEVLHSVWERSNFLLKYLWGLEIRHLKAHNFCDMGIFSSIIISQLRWLVFDNYQRCPVSLRQFFFKVEFQHLLWVYIQQLLLETVVNLPPTFNKIVVEIIIVKEKKNKLFFVGKVSFGYFMAIYTFHNESTEGSIALDR